MRMLYGSIALVCFLLCCGPIPPSSTGGRGVAENVLATATTNPLDWCAGHDLPESMCSVCNPGLIAGFKQAGNWCGEHGFPESACPQCNPITPPPSTLAGVDPADWCEGHDLPESMCSVCNPGLIAGFKQAGNWCGEHGFPESACPQCNPITPPPSTLAGVDPADWCAGHDLPESMCSVCNPGLIPGFKQAGDWCIEHGFPESACPTCNPQNAPVGAQRAALEARVVRLGSAELEAAAGIAFVAAKGVRSANSVSCTARVGFDEDRVADIRALVPGIVRKIHVRPGDRVTMGDVLFDLVSTRIGDLQASLTAARQHVETAAANLERERELGEKKIVSTRHVEVAEQELAAARAEVESAETTLRMAGADSGLATGRYSLVAPLTGVVARRPAMIGLLAADETSLATLVDTSAMWVFCNVPEAEAARVFPGQHVQITVEGGGSFHGRITWVSPEVDPRTRTVSARAEVANPQGRLRANQFARARIETGPAGAAVAVPRAAMQRVENQDLVFVRTAPGIYAPRVVTALDSGELVSISGNVLQGDQVVTTGAFLLRTEIMPGSIGAGCCELEPRSGER